MAQNVRIRQAAAYATAASIGAVVGTFTGTIFGIVLISTANQVKKAKDGNEDADVINITNHP